MGIMITSAAIQDRDAAKSLIGALVKSFGRLQIIWADGGYLGALVQWVKQLRPFGKLHLEIVRRCDHTKGFKVLPKRWIVERTFGWFSKARRLRTDYEVRLDHSEAMLRICMIRIMVKRICISTKSIFKTRSKAEGTENVRQFLNSGTDPFSLLHSSPSSAARPEPELKPATKRE